MITDIEKNCKFLVSPIREHIISFVPIATPIFYIVNDKSGPKTFIYRNDLGLELISGNISRDLNKSIYLHSRKFSVPLHHSWMVFQTAEKPAS